jgi:dephospho-CoA kinase
MTVRTPYTWVVGLTGTILSGKSTALAAFAKEGVFTLSADEIVHCLYQKPSVQRQLKKYFGTTDTTEISHKLFREKILRSRWEKYIHPLVLKEAMQKIRAAKCRWAVFEVPLLFEARIDKRTDWNVLVMADDKTLSARLKGRKMSRAEYERRLKCQFPQAKKQALADIILFHKTKEELVRKVKHFCKSFSVLTQN